MELNLLNPTHAVHEAFYKPDVPLSFALILLPAIISVIGTIIFGLQFNAVSIVLSAVFGIASWIAMGVLLYLIGFVIEGDSLKGKFAGILSALSLLWMVSAIMAIIGILLVATFPSGIITTINELQKGKLGATQAYDKIAGIVDSAPEQNSIAMTVFNVVSFVLMLLALLIVFLIPKEFGQKNIAKHLATAIIFILAWSIASGIASTLIA